MARPSSVMRPSPSMAPIAVRSARASFSAARGGGIEEGELARIGDAPKRAIERKPREIGGENFGRGVRLKPAVRGLLPQTITDAGLRAPRSPAPLIGVGPADADGLEARKPDVGLIDRDSHEPAVDDEAHALNRERRLGDRGGEHDLAPPRRRRGDGEILCAAVERAIERRNVDIGRPDSRLEDLRDAADFALARQEDEDRAVFACERVERHARDLVFDARALGCGRHIASRRGRRGPCFRSAARRREARAPARRRASPT